MRGACEIGRSDKGRDGDDGGCIDVVVVAAAVIEEALAP